MERVAAIRCRTRVRSWRMVGAGACPRQFRLGAGRAGGRLLARSRELMARADSLAKLAFAYGVHLTRRRLTRPRSQLATLLETYAHDGIRPLLPEEHERHAQLIGCINCGLCALAAGRGGKVRPPDLASSYMPLHARFGVAASDVDGDSPALEAAAAACPVRGPLGEVAAILPRLAPGCSRGPTRPA